MNGPIALVLLFFKYAIPIAAFAVTVDGLRRPVSDFPRPFWRWVWVVPQALLLVVTVAGYVGGPRLTAPVAGWILLLAFVCLVMQIGYLLEVVFPKRARTPGDPTDPAPREG
jgi:amino acid transporter